MFDRPLLSADVSDPLVLDDGGRLTVRPITLASKPVIAGAMKRLSPESIRRRFLSPRRELSDLELHRLTALDGWNQYALGACAPSAAGGIEGVAVARYARIAPDADTAEIAITVVDAMQGRGIGRLLMTKLVDAATVRGIRRLQAIVLPDNTPVIKLLRRLAPWAHWLPEGEHLVADIPLPEPVTISAARA